MPYPAGITDPTLVDNNDGTYEIVYTPSVAGDATLAITLFSVYVKEGCSFNTLPTSGCQVLVKVGWCKLKDRNPCSKRLVPALEIKVLLSPFRFKLCFQVHLRHYMAAADQLGVQVISIAKTTYSAYIVPQSTRVYGDLVTGFASSAAAVPDGPSGAFTINTFDTDGVQMGTWISTAAIKGSVQTSPAVGPGKYCPPRHRHAF